MPPGCEAALLACDLQCPGLSVLMQRLCSGTAGCLLVRPETVIITITTPVLLLCGCQPGPAQPSPLLPFSIKNQALKKNAKNMTNVPKWLQNATKKYVKTTHFLGWPRTWKTVIGLRRLQRIEGQAIPRTTKKSRKNDPRANTLHALVFCKKMQNKCQNWSP